MKKKTWALLVALSLFLGLGVFVFLPSSLEHIAKYAIENYGSDILGVPVTVQKIEIDVKSGRATLFGLQVANPRGYSTGPLFSLREGQLQIDPTSLSKNKKIINLISITNPKIRYEMGGEFGSNIQALQENLDKHVQSNRSSAKKSGPGPVLIIDRLELKEIQTSISLPFLKGKEINKTLPDIVLVHLGGQEGQPIGQISVKILNRFMHALANNLDAKEFLPQ